ncbi:cytochrome P450 monooxygenase [Mycena vulgaris]|nr:cytochrome P450 monooxygenase [Mycena vulgaris]
MHIILRLFLPLLATVAAYALLQLFLILLRDLSSPLRKLAGPKNPSFFFGNFKEIEMRWSSAPSTRDPRVTQKWRKQLGPTFQFRGLFNTRTFYSSDPITIDHILKHSGIYQKAVTSRPPANDRLAGEGLLGVEGKTHKRQANPFGTAQIRNLTDVFVDKSIQLRDIWSQQIQDRSGTRIDVLSWLSKMTLDVIGQAGFDYQFDSRTLFKDALKKLSAIGNQLLADNQAAIEKTGGSGSISGRRDLFSLLLMTNIAEDVPNHHRMSDMEVVGQIPTFLIAGHITTSSAITWALHALSINQEAQRKLRDELLTLPTENPTLEQLESLPYLEWVVWETMRVHRPVAYVTRIAVADDILLLSTPCELDGKKYTTLPVAKGMMLRVPIADVNTDVGRWERVPVAVNRLPGLWANLLTFLRGPRNCIGFRFSLAEQKALLFVLIRAFEFERAVADKDIQLTSSALRTPFVKSERELGSQMPLLVRACQG